jgi:hypothetical protein
MFAKETFQKLLFLNRQFFSHTSSVPFKKPNDAKNAKLTLYTIVVDFQKNPTLFKKNLKLISHMSLHNKS